jgi:hypothetical protein
MLLNSSARQRPSSPRSRLSSAGVVALIAIVCNSACRHATDLAPGVTVDGILALRPGMTYSDVVATIGQPFSMEVELPVHKEGPVMVSGRMVPTKDPAVGHVTLTYSRSLNLLTTYPMLWIHLQSGRVRSIYAKRYFALGLLGGDDEGIYGYSAGDAPWGSVDVLRKAFGH